MLGYFDQLRNTVDISKCNSDIFQITSNQLETTIKTFGRQFRYNRIINYGRLVITESAKE